MWFGYALIAALITGVGQVFVKKGQLHLTPLVDNIIATIIVNVILVPLLLVKGVTIDVGREILGYALIAATMYATFYYIISRGSVSLMISLINTFPVVTILLAVVFLNEFPNTFQWIGIMLIIVGFICISQEKTSGKNITRGKGWIVWGIVGSCAIGVAEFITKLATNTVDGFTFTFYVYLMYIPPVLAFFYCDKKGRRFGVFKNISSMMYTVVGIFFIELGLIAIALAYQHGLASLVAPVVATHMLVTAVLAGFILREKLTVIQKLGIMLNIAGVSVMGIWS